MVDEWKGRTRDEFRLKGYRGKERLEGWSRTLWFWGKAGLLNDVVGGWRNRFNGVRIEDACRTKRG